MVLFWGRRSRRARAGPLRRRAMVPRARSTLAVWDRVVPSAAPIGPRDIFPINRQSSPMFTTQAAATKYMGLLLSPIPRSTELMML